MILFSSSHDEDSSGFLIVVLSRPTPLLLFERNNGNMYV